MIEIKTEPYPKKLLKAICSECGNVVLETEWGSYSDYRIKKDRLMKKYSFCQKCGSVNQNGNPKWQKEDNGDWLSKCKNGDFLIWKYGNSYKWRYRRYGGTYADQIGFSSTLEQAKRACENHEEWKLEVKAI